MPPGTSTPSKMPRLGGNKAAGWPVQATSGHLRPTPLWTHNSPHPTTTSGSHPCNGKDAMNTTRTVGAPITTQIWNRHWAHGQPMTPMGSATAPWPGPITRNGLVTHSKAPSPSSSISWENISSKPVCRLRISKQAAAMSIILTA